jgi:putative nucleotidyltransferase with HDIG domain
MTKEFTFDNISNLASSFRITIILGTAVIISFLLIQVKTVSFEFEEGAKWKYPDLIAPMDFAIKKPAGELKSEKDEITSTFTPYYSLSTDKTTELRDKLDNQYALLQSSVKGDTATFLNQNIKNNTQFLLRIFYPILENGIVEISNIHENEPDNFLINITNGNVVQTLPISSIITLSKAVKKAEHEIRTSGFKNADYLLPLVSQVLEANVYYNNELTNQFKAQAYERVSLNEGMVKKGDIIIKRNSIISQDTYQKLLSYSDLVTAKNSGKKKLALSFFGYFLFLTVILILYILYVHSYVREVYMFFNKMLFMHLWIIVYALILYAVIKSNTLDLLVIPFGIIPIVIKNFYNQRLAFFTLIVTLLVASLFGPVTKDFIILNITAGILIIVISQETRYWGRFFLVLLFLLFTLIFTYSFLTFIKNGSFDEFSWTSVLWLGLNVFLTLLAYPLIPLLERIFGFTSSITLAELSDLNNPLLKELSLKAPGTFQHSLHVATLAESAAEKIGANSSIAKVGALYHDIGKIKNPFYFIENQQGYNPHNEMEYEESAKAIIEHVPEGVRIAKKNKLPSLIIDIIKSHHGTTRTEYFFRKYLQKHSGREVDEKVFTYPGPRPRTKEQVLVMIADTTEAAVKSLINPTEDEIHELVDKLIDEKINAGQFDRSEITFDDLQQAKKIIKLMLTKMTHSRIEYPDKE